MNKSLVRQRGFAMPALFLAVAVGFFGSLNLKGENGQTLAQSMGLGAEKQSEFAAVEKPLETDPAPTDKTAQ